MKILVSLLVLFLLGTKTALAQVVINELFPNPEGEDTGEFIELYNKGTEAVNLESYQLYDGADNPHTYTFAEVTLGPGNFLTIQKSESEIPLNNDEDKVFLKDKSSQVVDSISYDKSIEGRSWSRYPDGGENFVNNTDPTPNGPNSPPPTPTPVPTTTPSPVPTPKSTKQPSITPTLSLPTPTPSRFPTVRIATVKPTDLSPTSQESANSDRAEVMGISNQISPTPVILSDKETNAKVPVSAILFACSGVILLTVSLSIFFKYGSKGYNLNTDGKEDSESEDGLK